MSMRKTTNPVCRRSYRIIIYLRSECIEKYQFELYVQNMLNYMILTSYLDQSPGIIVPANLILSRDIAFMSHQTLHYMITVKH